MEAGGGGPGKVARSRPRTPPVSIHVRHLVTKLFTTKTSNDDILSLATDQFAAVFTWETSGENFNCISPLV